MNKWHRLLGCEVNVCRAELCDKERMRICALRKAYQERVAYLTVQLKELGKSGLAGEIKQKIEALRDYDREETTQKPEN